ncbi:MAG: hypothetical protein QOD05_2420 [Microbacteriaceae bacterium]|nr:hypothetical protein [Microbacteriaceae bacterium]
MSGAQRFTYRVVWSDEEDAWMGTVDQMPSLSWVAGDVTAAANGIRRLVRRTEVDRRTTEAASRARSCAANSHNGTPVPNRPPAEARTN